MNKEEFNLLLKQADLSKKEFASIVDMRYSSVNNWGSSQSFPRWVKSWLENYEKAKSYEDVKDVVFRIEKVEK